MGENRAAMVGRSEKRRDFPDDLRGKQVIILGAGRSGRAAAALLARCDAHVILADDDPESVHPDEIENVVASHVQLVLGDIRPELVSNADAVVTSPGVRLTHPLLARALQHGVPVIGELELGGRFARSPMVAVTGTNGKTTTVHWIAHLLGKAGQSAVVCGNVGTALCEVVARSADWFIVEASSFQLETVHRFHPRAAVILNLSADHLDRHPNAEDYLAIKARVAANQQRDDALVLNADDDAVWSLGATAASAVWGFSSDKSLERGVFVESGKITVRTTPNAPSRALLASGEIPLPGSHNLANALAAAATACVCGVEHEQIAAGLRDFTGVEHRLERVRELRGVGFVNDSKATNLTSLEVALRSFDRPIILIAGGRGKGQLYGTLSALITSAVRHLIVLGEEAERMEAAWGSLVPTQRVADMEEAVRTAARLAHPGEVVLLSPACASFDMYRNFEQRGRHFKELVQNL